MSSPDASTPHAVVTGASSGIGRAVTTRLVADGHAVLGLGRDRERLASLEAELDGRVTTAVCDVTDHAQLQRLLEPMTVDVLVANAGIASAAPVHRIDLDDWERLMAVNATGVFLSVQAVLPGMQTRDRGRIVVVTSVASLVGSRYTAAYTASKHAALGFTRSVAAEVAGTGVTANAVCPAYVDTPMTDTSVARIAARTDLDETEAREALTRQFPLGRLITPEEVAAAVAYLASDDAAPVNGQTVVLDGGGVQQ